MSAFSLRAAGPDDVAEVHRLVRGLAEYERLIDRFVATEADYARILFGPKPLANAVLAEVGETAVGVALWLFTASTFAARPILFLEDIFIEPPYRRRGIGLGFFRHLAEIAREANCWSMNWNVLAWNEPAIEFYRGLGARPVEDWMALRLDVEGIRALAG